MESGTDFCHNLDFGVKMGFNECEFEVTCYSESN